ncbi:MAG: PH domain-containing protein [Paludibacteraceae bacterium]|nr:PH domain-containing protein [Paludibacteraceae bacterium]
MQDINRYKICTEKADWKGICDINGINFDFLGSRKELEVLSSYLEQGEIVFALASGLMKRTITSNTFDGGLNTWLVVLTSERFLFMDAALLTSSVDTQSVRLNKVQAISASQGLLLGKISIDLGSRLITIDNCTKESVRVMADLANKWLKDLENGTKIPDENKDMEDFKKSVHKGHERVVPPVAAMPTANRNLASIVTALVGWSGINDFIWGLSWCGFIKVAFNLVSIKLDSGEHFVATALIAVALLIWTFVDLIRISNGSYFQKTEPSVGSRGFEGILLLFYIVLIIGSVVMAFGEFNDSRKKDNGKLASIREIVDTYNQNEAAAEHSFNGPRFTIAGSIRSVEKGFFDGYVVKFEGLGGLNILNLDSKVTEIELKFSDKQEKELMKIRKGNLIAASCIGRGLSGTEYTADKCILKYVKKNK